MFSKCTRQLRSCSSPKLRTASSGVLRDHHPPNVLAAVLIMELMRSIAVSPTRPAKPPALEPTRSKFPFSRDSSVIQVLLVRSYQRLHLQGARFAPQKGPGSRQYGPPIAILDRYEKSPVTHDYCSAGCHACVCMREVRGKRAEDRPARSDSNAIAERR